MTIMPPKPIQISKPIIIGFGIAVASASIGCSQKDDTAETIASRQTAIEPVDNQASRNNGAWGGVYMSRDELAKPQGNIVDINAIPSVKNDKSLDKWQEKFEVEQNQNRYDPVNAFITTDGKKLYHDSCAGCHMHDGRGAQGAGYYPPLAYNSKMESKYYIISILINGLRGMPSFHSMMNDEQMAAVTQYVQADLNGYITDVRAEDVAQLRHDNPPSADPSE